MTGAKQNEFPDVAREETLTLLRGLVAIRSENPPGNETAVAQYLAERLRLSGFVCAVHEAEPGRGSLVATLRGSGAGPSLAFNGHLDTGPIGTGWSRDPLGGVIENGRLYGRGAGDMKGGLAAVTAAAIAVARAAAPPPGDIVLLATADESSGSRLGMAHLVHNALVPKTDMAIVCEPSFGTVTIAQGGVVWIDVEVVGKSGQAARPKSGISAIAAMGRVLTALDDELPALRAGISHPLVPSIRINAGTITGGVKTNVIAERCVVSLDRRLIPGESSQRAVEQIRVISERAVAASGATVNVRPTMQVEPCEVPEDAPVVRLCQDAFRRVTGRDAAVRGTAGFTDARWFVLYLDTPACVFGPWYQTLPTGSISDIPDESVPVDEVVSGARVYAAMMAGSTE
jgi:acetylornithine deacetylase/succinyl-diaminopimelate desuccinylase family protein